MRTLTSLVGHTGRRSIEMSRHLLGLLGLTGRTLFRTYGLLIRRARLPAGSLPAEIDRLGVGSLGVTLLASIAVGVSLSFLSSEQFRALGGSSLLAFVFAKGVFREVGPVLAGIVMAVRVASQVTAGIASTPPDLRTVRGIRGDELDIGRLLLPAFLAILLVGPALYLVGAMSSLLAGVISQTQGSAEEFLLFSGQILDGFRLSDMAFGLYKSLIFGVAVVMAAGHIGFLAPSEPAAVQRATVTSIVVSAVAVLVLNALFALSYTHIPLRQHLQGL